MLKKPAHKLLNIKVSSSFSVYFTNYQKSGLLLARKYKKYDELFRIHVKFTIKKRIVKIEIYGLQRKTGHVKKQFEFNVK